MSLCRTPRSAIVSQILIRLPVHLFTVFNTIRIMISSWSFSIQIHWRATDTLQIVCMCAVCRCLPCVCCVTSRRNSYSKVVSNAYWPPRGLSRSCCLLYVYAMSIVEIIS